MIHSRFLAGGTQRSRHGCAIRRSLAIVLCTGTVLLLGACSFGGLKKEASQTATVVAAGPSNPALSDGVLGLPVTASSPASILSPSARSGAPPSPVCNCLPASAAEQQASSKTALSIEEPVTRLLAYSDKVRTLSPAELVQETQRLTDLALPADQLRLALVLVQSRQSTDWARGLDLVNRVLSNLGAEAKTLHPLARMVAARLGELRRQDEAIERQSQQLREVQRRLDQTTERLEALKAIERSISNSGSGSGSNSSSSSQPNRSGNAAGSGSRPAANASRPPAPRGSAPRRPATPASP